MRVLGLDTSNYTTSCAVFDGEGGVNRGRILDVRPGELGLRQSDALFQHVQRLPGLLGALAEETSLEALGAVGASTRPRAVEGSYMPCFLAGASQGQSLAHVLGVPFYAFSHQQGHLAAAAWSAGRMDLLDRPFLAWHLSGGTTELLGLQFPAGKSLDALSGEADAPMKYRVKRDGLRFSLSGMENQVKKLLADGEKPANIARFAIDTVTDVILRTTRAAQEAYPGLPVLCSGGVASNRRLRGALEEGCGAVFAQPQYAADNAMGTAILTWRALEREAGR